ncbi:MAG: cysteine--tRNA ligase [Hyphomonadaceae bacterium]
MPVDLHLTNSLTRRKERFTPADPKRVTMYVCGPTVYNYAHIGNARPPVVFDVLFRLLRRLYGEEHVLYARNFTDIDDRIIATANELGVEIDEVTNKFARIYEEDTGALGVLAPTFAPRATGHVADMIALIEKLIEKGAAYVAQTGVYFSVAADEDYGKLSNRSQDDLKTGTRIEGEDDKRAPSDFALWKTAKPGEPAWDAPFGRGRPGWHIECSAMIEANLGRTIDIHGGGVDLLFPHHENEIAQSETAHGHPLARYWMHNGFLTMDAEKMSKSLGNIVTVHDLLDQGWLGEVLRWALLSAHYRAPLDWTDALLEQSKASLDRLYGALQRLGDVQPSDDPAPLAFIEALADDLNTPKAIAELFALASEANTASHPARKAKAKAELLAAGKIFGILGADPAAWFRAGGEGDDSEIDALVAERFSARKNKNWAEADRLRDVLAGMGVTIMDGPEGSTWRRS